MPCMTGERVQSWRAAELGGLDLLHGTFTTHAFARHTHDTYSVGLLAYGSMTFRYRGTTHTLKPGLIGVINPDEPHDGYAETGDGWTYRNFYPAAEVLLAAFPGVKHWPHLPAVIEDDVVLSALVRAHRAFEVPASSLARESLMGEALTGLVQRHASEPLRLPGTGRESRAVALVRQLLEDDVARNVTLQELAALANLNAFTLLRAFKTQLGLPPHAYQLQVRLRQAKHLLRLGLMPAQVAADVGFADQSHLGRHFRRTFGVTPAAYMRGLNGVPSRTF